jgi:carboxymethylenebutenolidase
MEHPRMPIEQIDIKTAWGMMPARVARPSGGGPWPGVVVIHDAFGSGHNLDRHAGWLASCGFLTIAPGLLYWNKKFTCLRSILKDIAARKGRSFDEIEAARSWLHAQTDCTGREGVIGFCMGGAFAMLLAPAGRYAAAAPNYGKVPSDAETFFAGSCPIVGSFGRRDPTLIGAAEKLERALAANGIDHDVKLYPDASHGFLDDHSRDKLPLPLVIVKKVMNVGYDAAAADDAKSRIQTFFNKHLENRSMGSAEEIK